MAGMTSEVKIIEVRHGQCMICLTRESLVGINFRAKTLRFCRGCLFTLGDGIRKLKEQSDGKT